MAARATRRARPDTTKRQRMKPSPGSSSSSASSRDPSPPRGSVVLIGALLSFRRSGRRWPVACRAAISIGVLVLAGWWCGDIAAGLMATIGAFTSLYASGRPYRNRATVLAVIALSFAIVVTLGVAVQRVPGMAVPLVVVIAMVATFACNALRIGQPGAYMFALACAAATAMPVGDLTIEQISVLVLSGGAVSWIVHMAGALVAPRGPEKQAVAQAAEAVARFAACADGPHSAHSPHTSRAVDSAEADARHHARHDAALALHDAWVALVTLQPSRPGRDPALMHLRAVNRELHLLFAACVNVRSACDAADIANAADGASDTDERKLVADALARRARELRDAAKSGTPVASAEAGGDQSDARPLPLGRPGAMQLLRDNLAFDSAASMVAWRVGIAVALAGVIGERFGLERAYWAMAAAVLVLHQGLDWTRTLQRGVERTLGTLVGLCAAATILAIHPQGLWLVVTMMSLQFAVEMLVTRNYALAVVFVTSIALVIASGGHVVGDPLALLGARGVDTVTGCLVGLLVHAIFGPRGSTASIRARMVSTLTLVRATLEHLAHDDVTSDAALRARRDLQRGIFAVLDAYETQTGGVARKRRRAERTWPTVVATQRLGYRVLAACWSLEAGAANDDTIQRDAGGFTAAGLASAGAALDAIALAIREGSGPVTVTVTPSLFRRELEDLAGSLVASGIA